MRSRNIDMLTAYGSNLSGIGKNSDLCGGFEGPFLNLRVDKAGQAVN